MSCVCIARQAHTPLPNAKKLVDTAAAMYARSAGNPANIKKVITVLDAAIKADNNYYDAWINKMTLQCQLGKYTDALGTLHKMEKVFPGSDDVLFIIGILQYKTNQKPAAAATFSKLLAHYNATIEKKTNEAVKKQAIINKGIVLILLDKASEGKAILNTLYLQEKDPYTKSYMAFYINSSKEAIIEDRVPGN